MVLGKEGRLPELKGLSRGELSSVVSSTDGLDRAVNPRPRETDRQEEVEQFFVDMRLSNAADAPNPG